MLIILSPFSSKISTAAPKSLHCNSPGSDSDPGRPPRKAEQTSVPPLSEMIWVFGNRCFNAAATSLCKTDPVAPILFS